MSTIRKSLTITESQERWIKLQIERGGFTNDSEYLRHLIRMDQEREREFLMTRKAIDEGYKSGINPRNRTLDEIMEAAIERKTATDKAK